MSRLGRLRSAASLLALLTMVFWAPSFVSEEPRARDRPVIQFLSGLWNLFLPIGHEIDPNGTPVPGGSGPLPPPLPDLGHEIDPNG